MKLNLTKHHSANCAKPNCRTGARIERHHKGCEGMWIRHFIKRKRTKRYIAYKERYEAFHVEDVIGICQNHHWEIHEILYPAIGRFTKELGLVPLHTVDWKTAERCIAMCKALTEKWLKTETPGAFHKGTHRVRSPLHVAKTRKST